MEAELKIYYLVVRKKKLLTKLASVLVPQSDLGTVPAY
jgi:hypothetical protein